MAPTCLDGDELEDAGEKVLPVLRSGRLDSAELHPLYVNVLSFPESCSGKRDFRTAMGVCVGTYTKASGPCRITKVALPRNLVTVSSLFRIFRLAYLSRLK